MKLGPVTPEEAVELYLQNRQSEVAQSTMYEHRTWRRRFLDWVEDHPSVDDMTEMTRQKGQALQAAPV